MNQEKVSVVRQLFAEDRSVTRDGDQGQFVYFALARSAHLVKIGTTDNPRGRLRDIETMSPVPVELVRLIRGSRETERGIHRKFADLRRHGEWFLWTRELECWIEGLDDERDTDLSDAHRKASPVRNLRLK